MALFPFRRLDAMVFLLDPLSLAMFSLGEFNELLVRSWGSNRPIPSMFYSVLSKVER